MSLLTEKEAQSLMEEVDDVQAEMVAKDARIAALEAENERLKKLLQEGLLFIVPSDHNLPTDPDSAANVLVAEAIAAEKELESWEIKTRAALNPKDQP